MSPLLGPFYLLFIYESCKSIFSASLSLFAISLHSGEIYYNTAPASSSLSWPPSSCTLSLYPRWRKTHIYPNSCPKTNIFGAGISAFAFGENFHFLHSQQTNAQINTLNRCRLEFISVVRHIYAVLRKKRHKAKIVLEKYTQNLNLWTSYFIYSPVNFSRILWEFIVSARSRFLWLLFA